MLQPMKKLIALCAAGALVFAACGDDDDDPVDTEAPAAETVAGADDTVAPAADTEAPADAADDTEA